MTGPFRQLVPDFGVGLAAHATLTRKSALLYEPTTLALFDLETSN